MTDNTKKPRRTRQAVVVIHGMGEQVPMETLRSFVDTVWSRDSDIKAREVDDEEDFGDDNPTWSKPELFSKSFELRRITTRKFERGKDKKGKTLYGPRTDFFEFYWADIMQGTTWSHFVDWLKGLLLRWPWQVPPSVRWAWVVLWAVTIFFVLLGLEFGSSNLKTLLGDDSEFAKCLPLNIFGAWKTFAAGSAGILAVVWFLYRSFFKQGFLVSYLGDVARYGRAKPANIGKRHSVRSKGVALLKALNDDGPYKRIIVVGHSLGSIVAYDLLTHLWADYYENFGGTARSANVKALRNLEDAARDLAKPSSGKKELKAYRKLQRAYFRRIARDRTKRWVISDFITLGSPLTHADFLMTRTISEFNEHTKRRDYPKCPPHMELLREDPDEKPRRVFTYSKWSNAGKVWLPHHATVFAPVRWTNIHSRHWFTNLFIFPGDLVSGEVRPLFGKGIVDKGVWMWSLATFFFTHTSYWTLKQSDTTQKIPDHIVMLRRAVNLKDHGDPVLDLEKD